MNEPPVSTVNPALVSFAIYLFGVFFLAWLSSRVRQLSLIHISEPTTQEAI